jgi:dTDP-4-amino-4,6-dideoxygalactose transaminase
MIRLCVPYTDQAELDAIADVLSSGYLTQGEKVKEFEDMVARYVGTKYAFATSSCTTALHLSLVALGIGPGDEVLVPDFTFPATANVVIQQQARPVLVDIDMDTFTINAADLESKITKKTKAVIPVHAFGLSADMDPIIQLAEHYRFAVVEDAACALGANYKKIQCGALGDLGCFSFHPRKSITTGEGGMITTNSELLANRISLLRSHGGIRRDGRFTFEEAGFNYRLSEIHGAIGIEQMKKIHWILTRRKELADLLSRRLQNSTYLRLPNEQEYTTHTYQSFVVLIDKLLERDKIIMMMQHRGVETTIGTYALHAEPFFSRKYGIAPGTLKHSFDSYQRSLTLPLYPTMSESYLDVIADELEKAINSQL